MNEVQDGNRFSPYYYTRTQAGWGVSGPEGVTLMDGLNKGEAAGFALILNGESEESLWGDCNLIGRRSARRVRLLNELREKIL